MNRRCQPRPLLLLAGLAALSIACDYSNETKSSKNRVVGPLPTPRGKQSTRSTDTPVVTSSERETTDQAERRDAILKNVIQLIQTAAITPGGDHYSIATRNLNEYFETGTKAADFAMRPETRQFVRTNLRGAVDDDLHKLFESRLFDESPRFRFDARHIEDCMLYNDIVSRIAGDGDDLTRVRRVFDWMVRQVQLVPNGSLAPTGMPQAEARPYDALLRGMAVEEQYRSERGWVFMALCRQLGIDTGVILFNKSAPPSLLAAQPVSPNEEAQTIFWVCAALIDGKAYLFDQRLGIAIPNAKGDGVATLEEAMTDPQILARLSLTGQFSPFEPRQSDLVSSSSKIVIWIDSSPGYFSPKMRLLQSRLTGKNRTVLYRDPVEQRDHFAKVLGNRLGTVAYHPLPIQTYRNLFLNGQFVNSTQQSLIRFDPRLPLLYARVAHLKGEIPQAINEYVNFRFKTGALMLDKKTPIIPSVQRELDVYATYFLALANLEQGNVGQAEFFFKQTVKNTPEPNPNRPEFCFMFRWGAMTNLGLIAAQRGDISDGTRYLSQFMPTTQLLGNFWLARELALRDPFSRPGAKLPPAPTLPLVEAGRNTAAMK